MEDLTYRGIIIRQANYGDAHRMLWIYTTTDGIIKAVRYGIRGKKTSNAAAFQLFSYGDFKLRPSRGDIMTAVSADIIDGFFPLSEDIKKLALISYFSDITYNILGEANPDSSILSMFLNALHVSAYRDEPWKKLKMVYELKLMALGGYRPSLDDCGECGNKSTHFSLDRGTLVCREHHRAGDVAVDDSVISLMRYICKCDIKKMMAFEVHNEDLYDKMNYITERYITAHTDKEFQSLQYFYSLGDL